MQSSILNPTTKRSPDPWTDLNGNEGKEVKVESAKEASPPVVSGLVWSYGANM